MTTIAALVAAAPAAGHGKPVTIDTDEWRHVVEIADPSAGSSVAWHDITEWFCGYEYTRGADTYLGRYKASVATLEVCRDDDMLAPWNDDTSDLFGVHVPLGPGLLLRSGFIRVVGGVVTEWLPRFTNKVESWGDAAWSLGRIRRHQIVARDTSTSLVAAPLSARTEENWSDRMFWFLTDTAWPYGSLIYGAQFLPGPVDVLTLPDRPEASSAILELDAICDPVGLIWYTNRYGQLVVRPRTDDTFHADAFADGATGDEYPGDTNGPMFAWFACQDDDDSDAAAYAIDNQTDPFGFDTTERAVINHVKITYPVGGFDDDDPISIQRFDRKTLQASWMAANDVVAAQTLATRAYATIEARPLHTALGLEGFYPGPAQADYLTYTSIDHRNTDEGPTVFGNGWIRNLREQVAPRGCDVDWSITTIVDVYATEQTASMLPVEDLALVAVSETDAEFSWTNPAQTIIPTNTQIRLAGVTSIWATTDYPIGGVIWHGLDPDTVYTFQVRLVQYTDGLVTAFSPLREISFRTAPATVPVIDDGTGHLVPPDPGCHLEWLLESSSDGTSWSTVDSGTISTPPYEVDLSGYTFDPTKLYRLRQREVCAGTPGPYETSELFVGECSEPAILGTSPYDDADLEAYWPGVCPPDEIVEVITEAPALRGWAFDLFTVDGDGSVVLVADGDGPVAYGATPAAVNALHLDTTIACRVQLAHQPAAPVVLFSAAGLYIDAIASGAVWKVRARCQEAGAGVTTITPAATLAFGVWYDVALVHDEAAGDLILYVDGLDVAHALGTVTARTNPNRFQIGAANDGLITNCAVWSRVLAAGELPGFAVAPTVTINQGASQSDPAVTSAVVFDVVFSEAVTGFATGDVTLAGTAAGTLVGTVVDTGDHIHYTVTVSGYTTGGTVVASIAANKCTSIASSLGNAASTTSDDTITVPALTVTINQGSGQADPTTGTSIVFDVVFSQAVSAFTGAAVTLTGTAGATTAVVSGSGPSYTVTVTGMTSPGTVIASIAAGVVTAATTGVGNAASTSTDHTVTWSGPNLTIVGSLTHTNLDGANWIDVSGNYAYLTCDGTTDRVTVCDISNPASPSHVGNVTTSLPSGPIGIVVDGSYCYATCSNSGNAVAVVNVSTPSSPSVAGSVSNGTTLNRARGIKKVGSYCYVTATLGDRVSIVNVSTPASPTVSGSVTHTDLDGAIGIDVSGSYAYVAANLANRLVAVDVSNVASPSRVGSVTDATKLAGAYDVAVVGNYAYVTGSTNGYLVIVDISTPSSPSIVGSITHANLAGARGIQVSGSFAYVACSTPSHRITAIDVSNPASPSYYASVQDTTKLAGVTGIRLVGSYIYCAAPNNDYLVVVSL